MFPALFAAWFSGKKCPEIDPWLRVDIDELESRAILLIIKESPVVFRSTVKEMTKKHRLAQRIVARKTGLSAEDQLSRQNITTASKWSSAAPVGLLESTSMNLESSQCNRTI